MSVSLVDRLLGEPISLIEDERNDELFSLLMQPSPHQEIICGVTYYGRVALKELTFIEI